MIEVTFKGEYYLDVIAAIHDFLGESGYTDLTTPVPLPKAAAAVDKPVDKPKPDPHAKVAAKAKAADRMAKVRAAKVAKAPAPKPEPKLEIIPEPEPEPPAFEDIVMEEPEPEPEPETLDPARLTAIRVKTTEDLQAAYSNGKHKQVLALLAKYGNGAKSFRELQIKDFVPIRKAIDEGALT